MITITSDMITVTDMKHSKSVHSLLCLSLWAHHLLWGGTISEK